MAIPSPSAPPADILLAMFQMDIAELYEAIQTLTAIRRQFFHVECISSRGTREPFLHQWAEAHAEAVSEELRLIMLKLDAAVPNGEDEVQLRNLGLAAGAYFIADPGHGWSVTAKREKADA